MSKDRKQAIIISTVRDLEPYREVVKDACLRCGYFPIMVDHLANQDCSATVASIKLVKDADVYLGIFAHSYGSRPPGRSTLLHRNRTRHRHRTSHSRHSLPHRFGPSLATQTNRQR